MNAFRTELDSPFGEALRAALNKTFGKTPVDIRTMGGTVPIIPAINKLNIPAIIVPMVNMDNNHFTNQMKTFELEIFALDIQMCLER